MLILKKRSHYYLLYTALFVLLSIFCLGIYYTFFEKSILWIYDTFEMSFMSFVYHGEWLRQLFKDGIFQMWNNNIGYGADYLLTTAFTFTDPFSFLAVFFSPENSEWIFTLTVYLKLYLCGISYSVFAFRRKQPPYAVLCGALVYTFCACAYTGMQQAVFIIPQILFPLLLCGADELFDRNKPILYVLILALSAINNFYNTYMMAFAVIGYCALKWIFGTNHEKTFRNFMRMVGRFLLYSILAAGIVSVMLIPLAILMLSMGRLSIERSIDLFYDSKYYYSMFKGFISGYNMLGRDCEIGFSVLALLGVFSLFIRRKKHTGLKIAFALMSLGLCLPIVGSVMNGFSYVANRWIWQYALVVAYIFTLALSEWPDWNAAKKIALLICSLGYLLLAYLVFEANGIGFNLLAIALGIATIAACRAECFERKYYQRAMIVLTCITLLLPAYIRFSPDFGNSKASYIDAGKAYERISEYGGAPLINVVDTSDGTRYNRYDLAIVRNASLVNGASGIDFYFNMYNDRIDQFHKSIALNTDPWTFGYQGLDRRSELLALLGVDHFFVRESNPYYPVGYDQFEARTFALGSVPIQSWAPSKDYGLFTRFEKAVSSEDYDSLTPFTRQQLLMQACVVDQEYSNASADEFPLDSGEVSFWIDTEGSTAQYSGGVITAGKAGDQLTLRFDPLSHAELYIYLDNIVYDHPTAVTYIIKAQAWNGEAALKHVATAYTGDTANNHMYGGKHNWLLNLGQSEEPADRITITFNKAGRYTLDDIQLLVREEEAILSSIAALNQDVEHIRFTPNEFQLTVTNESEEYLMATVPYSTGWRAYDNGQEMEILPAANAFMAVKLQPGTHSLRFVYQTPGLALGGLISLLSIVCFAVLILIGHCRRRSTAA